MPATRSRCARSLTCRCTAASACRRGVTSRCMTAAPPPRRVRPPARGFGAPARRPARTHARGAPAGAWGTGAPRLEPAALAVAGRGVLDDELVAPAAQDVRDGRVRLAGDVGRHVDGGAAGLEIVR